MAKWEPGETGNPGGRPPKGFALTDMLEAAAEEAINWSPGLQKRARKYFLSQMAWQGLIEGQVTYKGDRGTVELEMSDWLALLKWVYDRLDGTSRQLMDVTSGNEPLQGGGMVIILPSNGREIEDQAPTGAADDIS